MINDGLAVQTATSRQYMSVTNTDVERYKLVYSIRAACDTNNPYEFYDLQKTANSVGLDTAADDLLSFNRPLTPQEQQDYGELLGVLNVILNSEPGCYGDGNLDKMVDREDAMGVLRQGPAERVRFQQRWGDRR